jgi:catechol 2,3-dioxygenase-like lactoylglutathione lyase family enzyme
VRLHFVELRVRDLAASVAWYRDVLGLEVVQADEVGRFALLSGGVALKEGEPGGGVLLAFEVASLERFAGEVKASDEGYRRVRLSDPDGYTVTLFEWTK